jgi:hypothetical protein
MLYYLPSDQFFPNSFARGPLLASKNNHEFSHPLFFWRNSPQLARASSFTRFLDHTQRTTIGRTPLDEGLARRRDLYLTTHNRQTSMPPEVFEPIISARERPQTYAVDDTTTGTGPHILAHVKNVRMTGIQNYKHISQNLF